MKLIFKNKQTQSVMENKFKNLVDKSIKNESGGFEIVKEYEFKPEILRLTQTPELIDYIKIVEVKEKKGTYVKENDTNAVLKNYEDEAYLSTFKNSEISEKSDISEQEKAEEKPKILNLEVKNRVEDYYKVKKYETKGYSFIFNAPNSLLLDGDLIEKDLFNTAYRVTRNTENNLIYNSIIKEPLKSIDITQDKTGEQIESELKAFYELSKAKCKNVYMTLKLLSNFEVLSKKLNIPLITENPNILGGKLLCGIPVIAFENHILKPYNNKEILICGDLYQTFDLIKNKEYGFDFSEEVAFSFNMTSFRILQNYDFNEEKENISVAQISFS